MFDTLLLVSVYLWSLNGFTKSSRVQYTAKATHGCSRSLVCTQIQSFQVFFFYPLTKHHEEPNSRKSLFLCAGSSDDHTQQWASDYKRKGSQAALVGVQWCAWISNHAGQNLRRKLLLCQGCVFLHGMIIGRLPGWEIKGCFSSGLKTCALLRAQTLKHSTAVNSISSSANSWHEIRGGLWFTLSDPGLLRFSQLHCAGSSALSESNTCNPPVNYRHPMNGGFLRLSRRTSPTGAGVLERPPQSLPKHTQLCFEGKR